MGRKMITYAIDYQFTGLNPVGYHVSSIVFHAVTTLVLYCMILALTGKSRVAFFAACLFAVHPVHTDSVAYISGRRDILSTLFYLLGFYCFLKARQKEKPYLLILVLAAYLLALASKEMAVTLPAMMLMLVLSVALLAATTSRAEGPRLVTLDAPSPLLEVRAGRARATATAAPPVAASPTTSAIHGV